MPFKGLREFIAKLETEGEVQPIADEVDCILEAGAILRKSAEAGLPAPFFQKIKGYPEGYRLFGGGASKFSRMAIAMDMAPQTHPRDMMEEYLKRRQHPIKPVMVKNAPCKENVHIGDEVDLLEFPVPLIHHGDRQRYIGTWHITISKDLQSGWLNWGTYRHALHNKNTIGISSDRFKHLGGMYYSSYEPQNKPMEVAIAIGVEPVSNFCATSPVPYGVSEVDVVGGIRGEPVELVKCETVDLVVPATAEIILEGEILPNERILEGPFGEYTGYCSGPVEPKPAIHIKAVTHRNNPIFTMSCLGIPIDDNSVMSFTRCTEFLDALKKRGLPITGVSMPPEAAQILTVVAVKPLYGKIADDVANVIWGVAGFLSPYVIVVEDNVDPFNLEQVVHALVTKCHPYKGIVKVEKAPLNPLLPFLDRLEQKYRTGPRVYFDCITPFEWDPKDRPQRISFAESYPLEVQKKALDIWRKYGLL